MSVAEAYDLGLDTLNAVVAVYAAEGLSLPSRQYVTAGTPVDDCPQVVVWLGALTSGLPPGGQLAPERFGLGYARTLAINVRITRCVPIVDEYGNPPADPAIEVAGRVIALDLWTLQQGIIDARAAGTFLTACQDLVIGSCTPFDWSGGVGGVELALAVQMDASL